MTPATEQWRDGLVAFLARDRQKPRHRSVGDPEPAVIAEAERIVTGSVRAWLTEGLAGHLNARRAWITSLPEEKAAGFDTDPAILLTTTPLGLPIAERLAAEDGRGIVCLLEVEYRRWCREQPDADLQHHVVAWDWVKTGLPKVRQGDFPAYPLAIGEHYWLHRTGIAGAAAEEFRNSALLAFNGTSSRLLAASTVETRFED